MNRSAFGSSKDIMIEGKDLDLKFMCDCRCHLKLDKSKKEYVFDDENRLIFAIKGSSFWDDYCKCDREIGEYMKETFRNMSGSSLPKSMPLPMKASSGGSSSSKKIMEEIKRNLNGNMVTTNQIAEQFYKIADMTVSTSQITNLAIMVEKENGSNRIGANVPSSAPRDKIDQLSAKSFDEAYSKMPSGNNQIKDIEKGIYHLSPMDKWISLTSPTLFWSKLIPMTGLGESEFHKIREAAGLSKVLEGDKIFAPSKKGRNKISVKKDTGVDGDLSSVYVDRLQDIGLYANYLAKSIVIKEIVITSMSRTVQRQAEIVYADAINYPDTNHSDAMYTQYTGKMARKFINDNTPKEQVLEKIKERIMQYPDGFKHVNNGGKVIDIGAGTGRQTRNTQFKESFIKFKKADKWISSTNSITWGDGGETNAYHTVFR